MTVGEKVLALRECLSNYPLRSDCRSFAGLPLYELHLGFFPGHIGLSEPGRESVSTIVLGSDWGNEVSFSEWLRRTEHKKNPTETNTEKMLREAGFLVDDCFFSNAWPVMRAGAQKEQGHHPLRDDIAFTNEYRDYLRHTIAALNLKLVISLGNPCAWFLGPFFGSDWQLGRLTSSRHVKIAQLDVDPLRERDGVVYVNATHPSHLNNRDGRNLDKYGDETGLLIYARRLARIPDAPGWSELERR
jgi:hypothetical protein